MVDTFGEGLLGDVEEFLCLCVDLSDSKGAGGVAVVSIFLDTKVNTDDVSLLESAGLAGDSVYDFFVDGDAQATGEDVASDAIAFECGFDTSLLYHFIGDLFEFPCGDTGSDEIADPVEDICDEAARFPHALDFFFSFEDDHGEGSQVFARGIAQATELRRPRALVPPLDPVRPS